MSGDLVSTGQAARALGVHRATLARWWQSGAVAPEYVTPGGQARWSLETLKQQLRQEDGRNE